MSRRNAVATLLVAIVCIPLAIYSVRGKQLFGDDPPKEPIAKLDGPTKAVIGQQLKYSSIGSIGQDIQFAISPPADTFESVKLADGKDTQGVIYTPSKPGVYYIYLMMNANNKTGHAVLTLTVTGDSISPANPKPPIVTKPDFDVKTALDADADPMSGQSIAQLEALFGQWDKMIDASNSWEQLLKTNRDAAAEMLQGKLPATRKVIKEYIESRFPKDVKAPFNKELARAVSQEILRTIRLSK